MSARHFYKEEIYFTEGFDSLPELGQEKVVDALGGNMAVGVTGGFYEEGWPICFISHFALNNLGMTFEEFMARTGGRFLEAVDPEDRAIFTEPRDGENEYREYRMIHGSLGEVWVCDFHTETETGDGRKLWICAMRVISEKKDVENQLHAQLRRRNEELTAIKEELERANRQVQESNDRLRRTLSEEEQYRQAVVSGAMLVFNVNVSRNLIEEEFYEIINGERIAVLPMVGLKAPCSADEFFDRWRERNVAPGDRELFRRTLSMAHLLYCHRTGKEEILVEYESRIGMSAFRELRHTVLLTVDLESGDVLALNNLKDVTDSRREKRETRHALVEACEAAQKATAAKMDFLSKMSHDLRTPMNAIIGLTTLAQTYGDDRERVSECLSKIAAASRQMLSLIGNVLDMNGLESGEENLTEGRFTLTGLMDMLREKFVPIAERAGQTLTVRVKELQHDYVVGDESHLGQALAHVVSNATKYTQKGGAIRLELRERHPEKSRTGLFEFTCEDNGVGMTAPFLERLFDPFEREEDARINKVQGTGLGLTIARSIISIMGGDIQVESEPGRGSKFTVTVPLRLQERELEARGASKEPEEGLTELQRQHYQGRRVLLVEDNELNKEVASEILKLMGLTVETAENGREALEMAVAKPGWYDLVLMDLQMPVMNGFEAASAIRALGREDLTRLPIIALSANTYAGDVSAATSAGMNGHLAKPLDIASLSRMLDRWL